MKIDDVLDAALAKYPHAKDVILWLTGALVGAVIPSAPFGDDEPVGWYNPNIVSFVGVKRTSCPVELQPDIEGTVAWSLDHCPDGPVTDKYGVTHHPLPLHPRPAANSADSDLTALLNELSRYAPEPGKLCAPTALMVLGSRAQAMLNANKASAKGER